MNAVNRIQHHVKAQNEETAALRQRLQTAREALTAAHDLLEALHGALEVDLVSVSGDVDVQIMKRRIHNAMASIKGMI